MHTIAVTCVNVICRFSLIKAFTPWICSSVRDVGGRPDRLSSVTFFFLGILKRSIHSYDLRWIMVPASYCANIQRWISTSLAHSAYRKRIIARWFSIVQSLCGASVRLTSLLPATRLNDEILREVTYRSSFSHVYCCTSAPPYWFYPVISKLSLPFWFSSVRI